MPTAAAFGIPSRSSTFRRLLALEPDHVEALGGISSSLRPRIAAKKRSPFLEKAVALDAQQPNWMCDLGSLREELGEFDEAIRLFRSVLEERPRYPVAVAHLLASRKGVEDTSLVEKAQSHIWRAEDREAGARTARVRPRQALRLGGGLRPRHRDYAAANDLVAEGHRYRPLAMESEVSSIVEAFDRDLFDGHAAFRQSEREARVRRRHAALGTTLTEQILASHRRSRAPASSAISITRPTSCPLLPATRPDVVCHARILDRKALEDCAAGFLQQLSRVSVDARRVVDKMPMNFMQLGLIALVFPRARIIHCLREPLDTCLSCYFENFHQDQRFATRLESLGHFHRQYERLMDHWRAVLPQPMLDVRYEDTRSPASKPRHGA